MRKRIRLVVAIILCLVCFAAGFIGASTYRRIQYEADIDSLTADNQKLLVDYENLRKLTEGYSQETGGKKSERISALASALNLLKEAEQIVNSYYVFKDDKDLAPNAEVIQENMEKLLYNIVFTEEIATENITQAILTAYFNAIPDNYTMYHSPKEAEEIQNDQEAKLYGIGIYVSFDIDTDNIIITNIMKDSPAEKSGLKKGDLITMIAGTEVTEETYSECLELAKGELNTTVEVKYIRDGKEFIANPVRSEVKKQQVFVEYVDEYAYITIMQFDGKVSDEFTDAIKETEKNNVKGYIFDVRDNPGGYLNEICNILDLLLPKGPIVNIYDYNHNKVQSYSSDANCLEKPMTVLCNGNTASAAELFTSALKDYGIATIVGTTTFGKGTMQSLLPLSNGGMVRVSVNYYNPPYSENYHMKGIEPDIVIEQSEYTKNHSIARGTEKDTQFMAAKAELDKIIKK